ncbi:MAG: ABC transporter ATP-binding protein [Granulosicoccus sp.]
MKKSETSLTVSLRQSDPIALDVSLHCQSGELLALVGPSGSGKSTVLRSIAGLQSVDVAFVSCGSNIWLDTKKQVNLQPQSRSVGLVFQHYALFPHLSALENVAMAIPRQKKNRHTKADRKAMATEWLARTNMTGLEDRMPAALSGGQKQRVALARALAREPQALLLDEPFSAVDQQTRRKLYRELAQLRSTLEIPMILVTHDIHEVQQLADSLCLIHKGRSLQQGPVQSVINAPANKAIAKLLGHQNIFHATVDAHADQATRYRLSEDQYLTGVPFHGAVGTQVNLLIAPSAITLSTAPVGVEPNNLADYLDSTESIHNLLPGTVRDAIGLGDELSLRLHLHRVSKSLRFRLSQHDATSRNVRNGASIQVHIRPSGIHAMAV